MEGAFRGCEESGRCGGGGAGKGAGKVWEVRGTYMFTLCVGGAGDVYNGIGGAG